MAGSSEAGQAKSRSGEGTEFLAEQYLVSKGYRILRRNFATRRGEIDLIAAKDGVVAFVEVRFRRSTGFGTPAETVTREKRRKISWAALEYDAQHGLSARGEALRFDVIAVTNRDGRIDIVHLENAFEAEVRPFSGRYREM